jgi:fermentation-respiration switch protein FrsA (DUF1100 family)
VPEEALTFTSHGGRCAAGLRLPEGPGPHPAVVLAHGFSAVRDQRLDAFAERFVAAGLATLVFDYRNFGQSPGEPRQLLDIGRQLEDWRSGIAYARAREEIDAERIGAWGSSFGGGHVLTIAAEDGRLAAAVCHAPFADGLRNLRHLGVRHVARLSAAALRDELGARRGRPPYYIGATGPPGALAVMTTPSSEPGFRVITEPGSTWENRVAARVSLRLPLYRPGRRARRIACPLLVSIAERDDLTPPAYAAQAAAAAPSGEIRRYDSGHFDLYTGEGFERSVADETAFLARHLLER